jgi:hypothetical protein
MAPAGFGNYLGWSRGRRAGLVHRRWLTDALADALADEVFQAGRSDHRHPPPGTQQQRHRAAGP